MKPNLQYLSESLPLPVRIALRKLLVTCRIKPTIDIVQIALTYHCNARCHKCSIKRYKKNEKEFSTEEVKSLIDQCYKMRIGRLGFFGGEPLLKEDIFELITYASQRRIKTEVLTNGYFLSEDIVKKLKYAGLDMISISIDSSNAKIHDELRNLPGCFNRAVKGIEYCVNNNIKTIINTVATKENVRNGDLNKIVLLGKKLKANEIKIIPPTMIGCWLDAKNEMLEDSDYETIIHLKKSNFVVSEIMKLKGNIYRSCRCRTGGRLYISCYGDVQPCWAVPVSFGNIRERPLREIVNSMKAANLDTRSYDCIGNDEGFRTKYLRNINAEANLPLKNPDIQ